MILFNPWHDLALANFSANYTPPASSMKLSEDLALLPIWYGNDKIVIAEGDANRIYLEKIKDLFSIDFQLISLNDINSYPEDKILPWGWNPTLRRILIKHGANELNIPSLDQLKQLKQYSDRKNAVEVLRELKIEVTDQFTLKSSSNIRISDTVCGESYYFDNLDELLKYLDSTPGDKALKMPVSGSGKGLIWVLDDITDKQTDWSRRVIREQGGVVAEPKLNKVRDFAMEFYIDKGLVRFTGYSLFTSASSGAYTGNELMNDNRIEEQLSKYVSIDIIHYIRESLQKKLAARFPDYTGYAGVDMMICKNIDLSGINYCVQPCVEINMRMNMGVVAHTFYSRFVRPNAEGRFEIKYFKKPGNALSFHENKQQESTLNVVNGKIESGYLALTPVTNNTHYIAYVII